jgi:hypothetical protein
VLVSALGEMPRGRVASDRERSGADVSYFLGRLSHTGSRLGSPRAAVRVRVASRRSLAIEEGVGAIVVVKPDTLIMPLPQEVSVVDAEGEVVSSSEGTRFYVTTQTIDPFHLVMEMAR